MIPIIDMHCDTISIIHDRRRKGEDICLRRNELHVDLEKMKAAGYMCQNFALFTFLGPWLEGVGPYQGGGGAGAQFASPREYALSLSDALDSELAANQDIIRPVLSGSDIRKNFQEGKLSALKTIEEGAVYEGSVERLKEFYDKGVRMTTLTWNFENELAFPNKIDWTNGETVPDTVNGLKKAGKEIVAACEELGILVDLSHLNDAGIYDVFDVTGGRTPIVASHSNARSVTGHCRNLTDDMLRRIADCGGLAGVNFCADFMNDRGDQMTRIEDILRHIHHMEQVAGIDAIGLGGDLDGIGNDLEFHNCGGMQLLAQALEKDGYSIDAIEKIFYKNVLRVYTDVLG